MIPTTPPTQEWTGTRAARSPTPAPERSDLLSSTSPETRWRLSPSAMFKAVNNGEVCFWHKADVRRVQGDVRFQEESGLDADKPARLLMTQNRHHCTSPLAVTLFQTAICVSLYA